MVRTSGLGKHAREHVFESRLCKLLRLAVGIIIIMVRYACRQLFEAIARFRSVAGLVAPLGSVCRPRHLSCTRSMKPGGILEHFMAGRFGCLEAATLEQHEPHES